MLPGTTTGDLPEPESHLTVTPLGKPTKMSDACGGYGQVGDEGLSPATKSHAEALLQYESL